ncbi:hypothetical protein [Nitrosomonas sp. Nm34]|uniref:hypothetical protein n=1 Tax=Nitrosomonas sp. Nm34 TaxID=1881055 RepID=UPI001113522E|nr:hypothetical protein [Nitrosomonas sp. Nm34]
MALSFGNAVSQEDAVIDSDQCAGRTLERCSAGRVPVAPARPSEFRGERDTNRPPRARIVGRCGGAVVGRVWEYSHPVRTGGLWVGSVELVPLKPNSILLVLLSSSTGTIGRKTRSYSDCVLNRYFHFAYPGHRYFRERQA